MNQPWLASLALALAAPLTAQADPAADLAALRQEIATLRATHEARLQALEQRLRAAEAAAAVAAAAPASREAAAAAPIPPPSAAIAATRANAFNPAISLILAGQYIRRSGDGAGAIAGFALPPQAELGPGDRGLSLAESELGLAASVDPWWRGAAHLALQPDDTVSVEEAYVQTTALGGGFTLKAGRFLSAVGYQNARHAHSWDFADNPLAYQALLGTQFGDDGAQLTWLAPSDRYVELGLELGRGRSFPGGNDARRGAGMAALTAHTGGDVGDSHSWRAGLSVLQARADGQLLAVTHADGSQAEGLFRGRTRVWVADAVWKWAPNGDATQRSLTLQGEYLRSARRGQWQDGAQGDGAAEALRATPSGWYLQGVLRFAPAWRVGVRTERLDAGAPEAGTAAARLGLAGARPRKHSLMLDYGPSEFSRLRLQLAQDHALPGAAEHQLVLQYQMSLGAHGAHAF